MSCVSVAGEQTAVFDVGSNVNLKINFRTAVFNFGTAVFWGEGQNSGVSEWGCFGMEGFCNGGLSEWKAVPQEEHGGLKS